jgi:FkbM family methyltransferase
MKLNKIIKNIFARKEKKPEGLIERESFFGDLKIILKGNHMLDQYQKSFPLYDRFLPVLCSSFDGLIIDVGANIGDTSIAVFSKNNKSFIVGVEPDDGFFSECEENINLNNLKDRFLGVKKFVTTNKGKYTIEKSNTLSTGSISNNSNEIGEINSISFSELMNLIPLEKKFKFDILKIDTDGFDWDVINSFLDYVNYLKKKPRFVFFEMQTYLNNIGVHDKNRELIIDKYKLSIEGLFENGYNNFCLLDNFGTPIKITQSIKDIFEIDDYVKRSQIYNSHSTIYYLDILAFPNEELQFVNESLLNLYKK